MRNILKLNEIILTAPSILATPEIIPGPDSRSFENLRSETALLFRLAEPTIAEHQLRYMLDEVFSADDYTSLLWDSFGNPARHFFTWHFGEIRFRREAVIEWVEHFSTRLSTLPLMAFLIAESGGRESADLVSSIFRGPVIPYPDDFTMESLLRRGFTETHLHFNGSAVPAVLWNHILNMPPDWIVQIENSRDQMQLWRQNLPEILPGRFNLLLKLAKWVRNWLAHWASRGDFAGSARNVAQSLENDLAASMVLDLYPPAPVGIIRHPGMLLPGGDGGNIIAAEGALWVHVFRGLISRPSDLAARLLHVYHLIMSAVVKILVHQRDMKGFYLFDTLSGLPLRDIAESEQQAAEHRLVQLHRTSALRRLEARISVKDDYNKTLERKVYPLVNAYRTSRDRHGVNFDLGIICHFIKRKEDGRENAPVFGDRYFACRHENLRNSLVNQASVINRIRTFRRDAGKFIVGVDGAGNELAAPPEVFAPVFRHIMTEFNRRGEYSRFASLSGRDEPPPLKFTFHVGEEFHHLLSGLRAVDEAVTFFDLPPGSRLGHGLVLGFDPRIWHERSRTTRMPRLEWLDNLVWLYRRLNGFSGFKLHLSDEIQRHSQYIYNRNLSPRPLHQAWRCRELGRSRLEMSLESQQRRERELRGELPDEAFEIASLYHFDGGVWNRGKKLFRVEFDEEFMRDWIDALKIMQENLTRKVFQRQIAIEACPLSNLRISQLRKIEEHPIFKWNDPDPNAESPRIFALVATDNTGIFQSSLPLEYSALARAVEGMDSNPDTRRIADWLETIYADTERFSFIPRPISREKSIVAGNGE